LIPAAYFVAVILHPEFEKLVEVALAIAGVYFDFVSPLQ